MIDFVSVAALYIALLLVVVLG